MPKCVTLTRIIFVDFKHRAVRYRSYVCTRCTSNVEHKRQFIYICILRANRALNSKTCKFRGPKYNVEWLLRCPDDTRIRDQMSRYNFTTNKFIESMLLECDMSIAYCIAPVCIGKCNVKMPFKRTKSIASSWWNWCVSNRPFERRIAKNIYELNALCPRTHGAWRMWVVLPIHFTRNKNDCRTNDVKHSNGQKYFYNCCVA